MRDRFNNVNRKIYLASKSPRRRELLKLGGFEFDILVSELPEVVTETDPSKVVEELSAQKAKKVFFQVPGAQIAVIGADTVVALDGKILGKPKDEKDAFSMLSSLQGRSHEVYTGVTIAYDVEEECKLRTFHVCTKVTFYPMTDEEIMEYIQTKDPMDKAGAYGIQSGAAKFVQEIQGDYNNVVGLPLSKLYNELKKIAKEDA